MIILIFPLFLLIFSAFLYFRYKTLEKKHLHFVPNNVQHYEGIIVKKESPIWAFLTYYVKININGIETIVKSIQYAPHCESSSYGGVFKEYELGDTVNIEYYINPIGKPEIKIIDEQLVPILEHHNTLPIVLSVFFLILGVLGLYFILKSFFNIELKNILVLLIFIVPFIIMIIYTLTYGMSIIKKGVPCSAKIIKKELIWGESSNRHYVLSHSSFHFVIEIDNQLLWVQQPFEQYSNSLKVGDIVPVRVYKGNFLFENQVQEILNNKNKKSV